MYANRPMSIFKIMFYDCLFYFQTLFSNIDMSSLIAQQREDLINEYMLILTMASTHPAFCFENKNRYREKFLEFEKLIYVRYGWMHHCTNMANFFS